VSAMNSPPHLSHPVVDMPQHSSVRGTREMVRPWNEYLSRQRLNNVRVAPRHSSPPSRSSRSERSPGPFCNIASSSRSVSSHLRLHSPSRTCLSVELPQQLLERSRMAALDAFVALPVSVMPSSSAARTSSSSTSRTKSRAQFLQLSLTLTSGINSPARGGCGGFCCPSRCVSRVCGYARQSKLIFHCCLRELGSVSVQLDRPIENRHLDFLRLYVWNFPRLKEPSRGIDRIPKADATCRRHRGSDDPRGGSAIGVEILGFVSPINGAGTDFAWWRVGQSTCFHASFCGSSLRFSTACLLVGCVAVFEPPHSILSKGENNYLTLLGKSAASTASR